MNSLDFVVVAVYLALMLGLGWWLKDNKSDTDYFLGGKTAGWFPLALSAMATQLSAISFISAPGFVGLRENGGLKWLTYEFGVPLAMLFVMLTIGPALYRSGVISVYDFLEKRIGTSTRFLISAAFQITRSFATGIMVYAMGLILEAVMGVPFWQSVVIISTITILYSLQGGMKAVIYSDAIQMALIVFGLIICGIVALQGVGGVSEVLQNSDPERLKAVDFDAFGFGDEFGFWPMLIGGFVLYCSYYGTDQSQAQRILSARNEGDVRRLLIANGLLRFPLTLLYCLVGLVIGVLVSSDPIVLAQIPEGRADYMMPIFILNYLPHGLIGLLVVAILSAAMSSLSGAINSLAAVTSNDLARMGFEPKSEKAAVRRSRFLAFFWGAVILIFSTLGGSIAPTVIEAINKVGSALYGPVLATFLIALFRPGIRPLAANAGLLIGGGLNLLLWAFVPELFWMWWNLIGLLVTGAIAIVLGRLMPRTERAQASLADANVLVEGGSVDSRSVVMLVSYFALIVLITVSFAWIPG